MSVVVRRATVADAAALSALRRDGVADDAFDTSFSEWLAAHVETHLPFVAELDGRVVGMAWLFVAARVPSRSRRDRRFGDVQSVYVLPSARGRGVGAALLAEVLACAEQLSLEHVTVHSSDRAVSLYTRAGFGQDRTWLRWTPT
ncbi:GNAT family N-acetyltransferase [Asanoa sp. WMMD1127]|uniref:GNAT family N-acetyltransferase n=1 Tax=Asanoa sp. WMMD1127 TaxID=3016107 RepID=UPI002415F13A|nr:GNAT family N-acetyltransferase [Asanoa sp. WMMD1127]MDG4826633.1 GNAT family N-acetyltransferase [Asanoa sp. WMMD1127]